MARNSKKIVQPKSESEPEFDEDEDESVEEVALDEDDVEDAVLDEDVIPKQKVEIDNTVRLPFPSPDSTFTLYDRTLFVEYASPFSSILHYRGQKPWSSLFPKPLMSTSTMT